MIKVYMLMKMTRKAVTIGLCPYTPPPFKTKSDTEKKIGDGVVFPTFRPEFEPKFPSSQPKP